MKSLSSATSIKCKFSNSVHKLLEPNLGVKRSLRWKHRPKELTNAEKVELFNKIVDLHNSCSEEYSNALYKKRERRRIQKARVERGYVPKKRTSKEEYESMLLHA